MLILAKLEFCAGIAWMIDRHIKNRLLEAIDSAPAVALLGPRQVGKTTLALAIGSIRPSVYLDLESSSIAPYA
jgi:predicted AAA+ superfamily ATPase